MLLPIGMLIYWLAKSDDTKGMMAGLWYYKENWVPSTIDQKIQSLKDLKQQRCLPLTIFGSLAQLSDILSQSDHFDINSSNEEIVERFNALIDSINTTPLNTSVKFDDVYNLKGTALMVDTIIEIDGPMEDIIRQINSKKGVMVQISEPWSLAKQIRGYM